MSSYAGTYEGMEWKSLYPNLYRVRYQTRIGHRMYDVDRIRSARDEFDARARFARDPNIRGAVDITHVHTLDPA